MFQIRNLRSSVEWNFFARGTTDKKSKEKKCEEKKTIPRARPLYHLKNLKKESRKLGIGWEDEDLQGGDKIHKVEEFRAPLFTETQVAALGRGGHTPWVVNLDPEGGKRRSLLGSGEESRSGL